MGDFFSFSKFFTFLSGKKKKKEKRNLKNSCHMPAKSENGLSHTPRFMLNGQAQVSLLFCIVLSPPHHCRGTENHFAISR